MVDVIVCRQCGKEGVQHEYFKNSNICKDCFYIKNLNEGEKVEYFEKKERNIEEKIKKLFSNDKVKFSLYGDRLPPDDYPIKHPDGSLFVKCAYCGGPFRPTKKQVRNRLGVLEGHNSGESRFYCSNNCKKACPTFNQKHFPKGFKKASSREVQPELRQLRLEIDSYKCQKCDIGIKNAVLHCHHITGVKQNPIESADLDNTITLCKPCHKFVHFQKGCRYFDMRCDKHAEHGF